MENIHLALILEVIHIRHFEILILLGISCSTSIHHATDTLVLSDTIFVKIIIQENTNQNYNMNMTSLNQFFFI